MRTSWAVTAVLLAIPAYAQDVPVGSAQRGHDIYIHQLCQNCHGTVGQGGGVAGPRIAPGPLSWQAFERQVRIPRQAMPPYTAKNLPDQDLSDVYAYLASIKSGPPAKNIPLLNVD